MAEGLLPSVRGYPEHMRRAGLVLALLVALTVGACATNSASSAKASCSAVQKALSVALAVPQPNQSPPPSAMAVLTAADRKIVENSRATFLNSAAQAAQSETAFSESQYQNQLAQGPFRAGPPAPPVVTSVESVIVATTPSWQAWASKFQGHVMSARGCPSPTTTTATPPATVAPVLAPPIWRAANFHDTRLPDRLSARYRKHFSDALSV